MCINRTTVTLSDCFYCFADTLKLLLTFCHKDNGNSYKEKTLVILTDIIHNCLNLFFLRSLCIRDFCGEVIVLITDSLLLDNIRLNTKIFLLKHLCGQILWHRHYINTGNGVDRKGSNLIDKSVR